MTRRSRANRPPRLDDLQQLAPDEPRVSGPPSVARTLSDRRVAGTHARCGPAELKSVLARLASGHADANLGLDLGRVTREEAETALEVVWGASVDGPRVVIDPERTVAAAARAAERI